MPCADEPGHSCQTDPGNTRTPRCRNDWRRRPTAAQAVVEFAIASVVFFSLLFGTIDFGRAIFMYAELDNAVREGARYAIVNPGSTSATASFVVAKAPDIGLNTGDVTTSCNPDCASGSTVTVSASLSFQAITQKLLGIGPITLSASATDTIE